MTAQTVTDLRATAEVLRRDGWTQGDLGECGGPKCLVGAAYFVASDETEVVYERAGADSIRRAETLATVMAHHVGTDRLHLPTWNDTPGRTADEVIAALEAAADRAEATDV